MAKSNAVKKSDDPRQRDMFERSVKAKGKDLKKIANLVAQYEALNGEREAILATAEELWTKMLDIQRRVLPSAFAEAGVNDFTDASSGAHLEVDHYLSGTWPKDQKKLKQALAWLKKVHAENLLKCQLISKFDREDAALARKEYERLAKTGKAVVELKETVHHQTLHAFFRERLKAGKEVPLDIFDGETGTYVRIDFPKQEKGDGQ